MIWLWLLACAGPKDGPDDTGDTSAPEDTADTVDTAFIDTLQR